MVDEEIILRGISFRGASDEPTILRRTEQDFIPALLDDLGRDDGLKAVERTRISPLLADGIEKKSGRNTLAERRVKKGFESQSLRLFQPVHRVFNVVLLEALCDRYGEPRLDPQRIESAGLVVRRVKLESRDRRTGSRSETLEGWMRSGKKLRGWVEFKSSSEKNLDPEPSRRRRELSSGHPQLDRLVSAWQDKVEPFTESVSPLFVAPPEICKATSRTLLYGVLPVISSELSDAPLSNSTALESQPPAFDLEDLSARLPAHLPYYLQAEGQGWSAAVPRAGQTLSYANADDADLSAFVLSLRQLKFEFNAFGESAEGVALFRELNEIKIDDASGRLGDFLKSAASILVDQQGREQSRKGQAVPSITMPKAWSALDQNRSGRILTLVQASLAARLAGLTGGEGRFDDSRRLYRARAFVRVKREDGCPPEIVWSRYSEPFAIAPWYESGDQPPVQVALPDATDKDFL